MFDLSTLDTTPAAEQGVDMKLRHPDTEEPIKSDGQFVTFRVLGQDSKVFRKIDREQTNKRFKRMGRNKAELDAEELEIERLERVLACVIGWENVYLDNMPLPFSQENAHHLFVRFPWIVEQINRFITDRANFLKVSLAS